MKNISQKEEMASGYLIVFLWLHLLADSVNQEPLAACYAQVTHDMGNN